MPVDPTPIINAVNVAVAPIEAARDEAIRQRDACAAERDALRAEVARLRPKLAVGLNLEEVTEFSTAAMFANLALYFSPNWGTAADPTKAFFSYEQGTEPPPPPDRNRTSFVNAAGKTIIQDWARVNADGYPLEDAGCYTYASGYAFGDYAFRMDGSGAPNFSGRGRFVAPPARDGNSVSGTVRIDNAAVPLLRFTVTGIDPANPPRNFRLIVPGLPADTTRVTNPAFVDAVAPFPGPLRMSVGPQRINMDAGDFVEWAERVRPEQFTQTGNRGVAYEYLIAVANECGKDVWLSTPDRASDDFLAQFAALIADRLVPRARAYVECRNEIWNQRFRVYNRNFQDAAANPDLTAVDGNERAWQQMGWQARRVARALKPRLGARVRVILGGQASYAWNSPDRVKPGPAETALNFLAAKYPAEPPASYLTGLAVACYRDAGSDASSVEAILAGWDRALADADLRAKDARHRAVATKYGIRLWAYESAITVRGKQAAPDPRDLVQSDPRTGDRVTALLTYAEQAGFDGLEYYYAIGKLEGQTEGRYPLARDLASFATLPKAQAAKAFAAARADV